MDAAMQEQTDRPFSRSQARSVITCRSFEAGVLPLVSSSHDKPSSDIGVSHPFSTS